jgi:integrase
LSASPITADGLIRLIQTADLYQLALFSFHIFHGVRVAEPCWVMVEFLDAEGGWLDYRCIEELGYRTKGEVDKRLPVPEPMMRVIARLVDGRSGGPLLLKRRAFGRPGGVSKGGEDLRRIIESVHRRHPAGWSGRLRAATAHLKTLGTIEGDDIRREFAHLVRDAGIQSDATPKALRHHFATALERADVPYYTRKYLLGHRLGEHGGRASDITAIYTHLEPDLVKAAYQRVLDGPLAKIRDAFASRLHQLMAAGSQAEPRQS